MNDIEVELLDVNYLPDYVEAEEQRQANEIVRQTNETTRQANEITRQANEQNRIALYNELEEKKQSGYWKGDKGDPGEDGFSPIVTTSKTGKTTTLTIEDAEGTKTATILDGDDASVDVQVNGTSIMSGGVANLLTKKPYNANTNKLATVKDLTEWSVASDKDDFITFFGANAKSYGFNLSNDDETRYYTIYADKTSDMVSVGSSGKITLEGNAVTISNVVTPVNGGDAVNKSYVDGLVGDIGTALDLINGESVGD